MAIRLSNQRDMQITRLRQAEQFLQVQLAGRGVQQVGTPNDIGDALPGIVQDHGQLIGVEPVAAADHEIADFPAQVLAVLALHPVEEVVLQLRYAQADGGIIGAMAGIAAQPRINPVIRFQLFARTGAGIGQAVIEQAIEHLGVGVVPLALANQVAIPLEAIAFQCLENGRLGAGFLAGWIKVFHAHQPASAHRARIKVRGQRCDQRTEMQMATGRGGKAPDVGG
ncbi:hypothetical protein D3C72_1388880 [compost metagenome]